MTKNYKKMAANVVNINNCFESDEEIIALLKQRTRKFDEEELARFATMPNYSH